MRLLQRGAAAEEAVVAAISVLEDDEVFDAGRGSVFTEERTRRWILAS